MDKVPNTLEPSDHFATRVAVVVINWNRGAQTLDCLDTIVASGYSALSIVIVDNDSRDDSPHLLEEWVDRRAGSDVPAVLVRSADNVGFAGGANLGTERALADGADHVFFLNNDATVAPDAFQHAVAVARDARAEIVGATVLDPTGRTIRFARRRWPYIMFGFASSRSGPPPSWSPSAYVDGAAFLASREVLQRRYEEHGYYFDPLLFMYWEDADLCLYAAARGYRCVVARDAIVYHEVAASSGGPGNPRSFYYGSRNRVTIANRWLALPWRLLFHLYYVPSRLVLQVVRLRRFDRAVASAIAEGVLDGYRGVGGRWAKHAGHRT